MIFQTLKNILMYKTALAYGIGQVNIAFGNENSSPITVIRNDMNSQACAAAKKKIQDPHDPTKKSRYGIYRISRRHA